MWLSAAPRSSSFIIPPTSFFDEANPLELRLSRYLDFMVRTFDFEKGCALGAFVSGVRTLRSVLEPGEFVRADDPEARVAVDRGP